MNTGCPECSARSTNTIVDGRHIMECGSRVFFGRRTAVDQSYLCREIASLRARVEVLEGALEAVSCADLYPGGANPFYAISEDVMDAARAALAGGGKGEGDA